MSDSADWSPRASILAVVATLAAYNALVNEALPAAWHGVAAALAALVLWWIARRAGLDGEALGLARSRIRSGLRWGAAASGAVVAGIATLAALPTTRSNFEDASIGAMDRSSLVWEMAVRIPTVTAGFEELAFRGVLLGVLLLAVPLRWAVVIQAVLFGLWHVLPTHGPGVSWGEIVVAVGFTAVAGVVFAVLRLRSRSLLAPWLLHTATNSATMLAAWLVT